MEFDIKGYNGLAEVDGRNGGCGSESVRYKALRVVNLL